MKAEAIKALNDLFYPVEFGPDGPDFLQEKIILVGSVWDCFNFDEYKETLKSEFISNLTTLNNNEKVNYFKEILYNFCPAFYKHPDKYSKEIKTIEDSQNQTKAHYTAYDNYIVVIYGLWEFVIGWIREYCERNSIISELVYNPLINIEFLETSIELSLSTNQRTNSNCTVTTKGKAIKTIQFNSTETIDKLFGELKGYFPEKESELQKALNGEQLNESLHFPHNQNRFVEVFKRAKYNSFILSTPTEIKDWICKNFNYVKTQGKKKTVEDFKENSVWDILTKAKCEPSKKSRICTPEWLPFISQDKRKREAQNEKL